MASLKQNIFWNSVRVGSNLVFPLVTFPYVSRVLGPDTIGLFNYVTAIAAYFMTEKSWTFCPYTTAIRLQKNGACIYELKNSPPEQVVYYLVNENRKTATIHKFLELLTEKLKTLPKDKITSFLS